MLIENLLASVSQHQRQKNGEQTVNRMRSRMMNGYWVFQAPIGYRYSRTAGHGKLLVRDEPVASILQEALEGYASARFETQVEVKRFLENNPNFPKDTSGGVVRNQRVYEYLTRLVYAGYIKHESWDLGFRKGHREGLISLEAFERIQARLKGTDKAPARKDIYEDFPLRGFVLCGDCGKPLTACWSRSKTGTQHPYYLCANKACTSYRKPIRRDQLEGDFEKLLTSMQPTRKLFSIAKEMFVQYWNLSRADTEKAKRTLQSAIKKADTQIDGLLARIVETDSPSVITAYERKISKLEREKALLEEKSLSTGNSKGTLEESFEPVLQFLANPWNIWNKGSLAVRKTVLRLAFLSPVSYSRNSGVRTPEIAFLFRYLADIQCANCKMAHVRGRSSNTVPHQALVVESNTVNILAVWNTQLRDAGFDADGASE